MGMPRYQCHKEVSAFKIKAFAREEMPKFQGRTCRGSVAFRSQCGHCERCTWEKTRGSGPLKTFIVPEEAGFAPVEISQSYLEKHQPCVGGYYVVYEDGYLSFSPAEAFESGYTRIVHINP